jgi:hypothetical protein
VFAKNLERVLFEIRRGSDISPSDPNDVAERFESLRRYRRLPPGRENRAKHLSCGELAAAILSLVPSLPTWAGHAVVILSDLRPVGGIAASFFGSKTLGEAIEILLSGEEARASLSTLMISTAEDGTNISGFAKLVYRAGADRLQAIYVSKMAVSLLQPGAEEQVDEDRFYAPISKCLVFTRTFFDRIATKIAESASLPIEPEGDGSEYDAEESKQARYRSLGVQRGSRFLNIGVHTQVTWPPHELLVRFDNYNLVLMPKTRENTQSVHIDLHANRVGDQEALTIINRFLSVLAWCDDQVAVAQGGWSGNPVPVPVTRRDLAFATTDHWLFDRRIPQSDEIRRALALYREGLNAEDASLGSYAVLSYFKVIEIRYPDAKKVKRWISDNFAKLASKERNDAQFQHFLSAVGDRQPEEYINDACRVAVAHASEKHPSDVEDAAEATRLYSAAHVLRLLARLFIAKELGVSEDTYTAD